MKTIEIFEKISATLSAYGAEKQTAEAVCEILNGISSSVKIDNMGNVIAEIGKVTDTSPAIFAPIGRPGFVVTHIDDDGRVRVGSLGKCEYRSVCHAVLTNGKISGVLTPSGDDCTTAEKSYVNFGFKDKAEAEGELSQGDVLFIEPRTTKLFGGKISGVGAAVSAVVTAVLSAVGKIKSDGDGVYLVFCTQSGLNQRGVIPATFGLSPKTALCVEPYCGGNIGVRVLDKLAVYDEGLTETLYGIAKGVRDDAKKLVTAEETSDAGRVATTGVGVRTASLMLPCEGVGTTAEVVSIADIEAISEIISIFPSSI